MKVSPQAWSCGIQSVNASHRYQVWGSNNFTHGPINPTQYASNSNKCYISFKGSPSCGL